MKKYKIHDVSINYGEMGDLKIDKSHRDGMIRIIPQPEYSYDISYEDQCLFLKERKEAYENNLKQLFSYSEKNIKGRRYMSFQGSRLEILIKLKEAEKMKKEG